MTQAETGFTLIEVMLAVAVVAFGILAVLQSYSIAVTAVERAEFNMNAAYLLKSVMGDVAEKALSDGEMKLGRSSGRFGASFAGAFDGRAAAWSWERSARNVLVKARPVGKAAGVPEEEYTMTEVDIKVADNGRTPASVAEISAYYGN